MTHDKHSQLSTYKVKELRGQLLKQYFQTQQIIHAESQLCLSVGDPSKAKLFLDKCDGSANQIFTFTNIYSQDDFDL